MKVDRNSLVNLDYLLRLGPNEVYPSSGQPEEISICMSHGEMPPGLEEALLDMEPNEHKVINLSPQEAFGEVDESLIVEVPRAEFDPAVELRPGLIFEAADEGGKSSNFFIREVHPEKVLVDFNHPLAGKELQITIKVREVREATPEDVDRIHASHGWKSK